VQTNVGTSGLSAAGERELMPVGVKISELVQMGRRAVRHYRGNLVSQAAAGNSGRVQGKPRGA
jgi:hypothetical protein